MCRSDLGIHSLTHEKSVKMCSSDSGTNNVTYEKSGKMCTLGIVLHMRRVVKCVDLTWVYNYSLI